MSEQVKRVTLVYEVYSNTDEEAVQKVREVIENGESLNWFIQDLPDLGTGRWELQ